MKAYLNITYVDTKKETIFIRAQQEAGNVNFRAVQIDEDDLEMPVRAEDEGDDSTEATTTAAAAGLEPAGMYYPGTVIMAQVREFHQRKNGRSGTRIVFLNGAATIAKDSVTEIQAMLAA